MSLPSPVLRVEAFAYLKWVIRHILASPGYAPGTIAVNVKWMERGFNAGQTGGAENAGVEISARCCRGWKMQEWNLREEMFERSQYPSSIWRREVTSYERLTSEEFATESPTLRGTSVDYEIYSWSTEIVRPR